MHTLLSGQGYRRVGSSSSKGPEWHGPCPVCGGNDRFHVWPEQGKGTFWCRAEEKGGDLIEYYRWKDGLGYKEACERAGQDAKTYAPQSTPSAKREDSAPAFVPRPADQVAELWSEHAAKFADGCHVQLLNNPAQLAWLAARGIDAGLVARFCLGWNPADTWRAREAWGLPTVLRDNKKPKKLWLPLGLVIPIFGNGPVVQLRIRRPNVDPKEKYYVVPGSSRQPLVTKESSAYVVVEAGLDAMCLAGAADDLVGVIAMGNSTTKPTEALWQLLQRAVHVSVSLDSDTPRRNPRTGKWEAPGATAARWWSEHLPTAERVPMIGGKDPGEAYAAGVDLRAWVLAGLPPRYHLREQASLRAQRGNLDPKNPYQPVSAHCRLEATPCHLERSERSLPPDEMTAQEPAVNHRILTLTDGQEIHVTDNQAVWKDLSDQGQVVFSENELQRLQVALVGLDDQQRQAAVGLAVDAKTVFSGAYIRRGEVMPCNALPLEI